MRNASGHNYWNSSFIIDVAMGQIPRSTERSSSYPCYLTYGCSEKNVSYDVILTAKKQTRRVLRVRIDIAGYSNVNY